MAKLPPKIPSIVSKGHQLQHQHQHNQHQWPDISHDNIYNLPIHHPHQPWVEEFMEFSAAKRSAHRRSVSDSSVAFIEAGTVPFLSPLRGQDNSTACADEEAGHFDKFDDEQFMSMFNNDFGGSSSNPSSTSDHNSTSEDRKKRGGAAGAGRVKVEGREEEVKEKVLKSEAEEVESSCKVEKERQQQQTQGGQSGNEGEEKGNNDNAGGVGSDQQQAVDPKRFKRILANRQSAQRSRVRKLQYISELERSVTALQSEVSVLSPRVAYLDHQRMILNVDNSALKAKIAALAQDKIFKDAHQEALKREIERLRQVHYQQSLQKESIPPSSSPLPSMSAQPQKPDIIANEGEQLTG